MQGHRDHISAQDNSEWQQSHKPLLYDPYEAHNTPVSESTIIQPNTEGSTAYFGVQRKHEDAPSGYPDNVSHPQSTRLAVPFLARLPALIIAAATAALATTLIVWLVLRYSTRGFSFLGPIF